MPWTVSLPVTGCKRTLHQPKGAVTRAGRKGGIGCPEGTAAQPSLWCPGPSPAADLPLTGVSGPALLLPARCPACLRDRPAFCPGRGGKVGPLQRAAGLGSSVSQSGLRLADLESGGQSPEAGGGHTIGTLGSGKEHRPPRDVPGLAGSFQVRQRQIELFRNSRLPGPWSWIPLVLKLGPRGRRLPASETRAAEPGLRGPSTLTGTVGTPVVPILLAWAVGMQRSPELRVTTVRSLLSL